MKETTIPLSAAIKDTAALRKRMEDSDATFYQRTMSARKLVFAERCKRGVTYPLTCLRLGAAHVLHLPGEVFVEYQIAAQACRPGEFVAVAAYGDCGLGYIGTRAAYEQGGYECDPSHSRVAADIEDVFMDAIRGLLAG